MVYMQQIIYEESPKLEIEIKLSTTYLQEFFQQRVSKFYETYPFNFNLEEEHYKDAN